MIIKWALKNWLGIITAFGIFYGILLSTYNFLESRKGKKRRLKIKVSAGWLTTPAGLSEDDMILIDVSNPGDRTVTIQTPYLRLPDKSSIICPIPTANVRFPFELKEGNNCIMWMKRKEVIGSLMKRGYEGEISLRGAVTDPTGKVHLSRKPYKLKAEA